MLSKCAPDVLTVVNVVFGCFDDKGCLVLLSEGGRSFALSSCFLAYA